MVATPPQSRNQLLYPLDDPNTAFDNALRRTGINPYATNPFTDLLKKNAQGARIAYLAHGKPEGGSYADPSADYGNFLSSQIQNGSIYNTLNNTAQSFPEIVRAIQQYQNQLNAGNTQAVSQNPLYAGLNDIFGADGGRGALSAFAQLRTPSLGSLGSSWARALQQAGEGAMTRYAQQGGPGQSPWDWLFPSSGVF
jgi:hypothetical protein